MEIEPRPYNMQNSLWEAPLTQPNKESWRKPPKNCNIEAEQFAAFQREDQFVNIHDLKEKNCPPWFQISIGQEMVTFYKTTFGINKLPFISQAI